MYIYGIYICSIIKAELGEGVMGDISQRLVLHFSACDKKMIARSGIVLLTRSVYVYLSMC